MVDITTEALKDLYTNKGLTTRQIAERLDASQRTVARRLHQFGIEPRPPGPKRHRRLRSKVWMERQYTQLEKSTVTIAGEIGASPGVVSSWLRKHEIPRRPIGSPLKGKKMSIEGRRRISVSKRGTYKGPENPNWKGGYIDPTYSERRSYKAKQWRDRVKERDGHKCIECGTEGVPLHTHHIKPWKHYPGLRFDVNNGVTLCVPCHEKAHGFAFDVYSDRGQGETPRAQDTGR